MYAGAASIPLVVMRAVTRQTVELNSARVPPGREQTFSHRMKMHIEGRDVTAFLRDPGCRRADDAVLQRGDPASTPRARDGHRIVSRCPKSSANSRSAKGHRLTERVREFDSASGQPVLRADTGRGDREELRADKTRPSAETLPVFEPAPATATSQKELRELAAGAPT